ncbi:MAG TPA: hypothetical protein VL856_20200 [Acidimicrobiia bacterium]|nr:hypothetical protein [Acidimicrobiia bacterium]
MTTTTDAEQTARRLLARGDLLSARELVRTIPSEQQSLGLRVLDAAAAIRMHEISLGELDALRADAADAPTNGPADYRTWVDTLRAEYLLLKSDPAGIFVAQDALTRVPTDGVLGELDLIARGRLRFFDAVWRLFTSGADTPGAARTALASALADFSRAGWEEERLLSIVLFSVLWTGVSWDDVDTSRLAVREAVDRFRALGSQSLPVGLVALATIAFIAGDLHEARAASDEAAKQRASQPIVGMVVDQIDAFAALVADGATPETMRLLDGAADTFRTSIVNAGASMYVKAAAILADRGEIERAREWFGRSQMTPDFTPAGALDRDALAARLTILDGDPRAGRAQLDAVAEAMRAVGLGRLAGVMQLRGACDCRRVGEDAIAAELRSEGLAALPARARWTLWEAVFAIRAGVELTHGAAASTITLVDARDEILALGPDMIVRRHGELVRLPSGAARLLAVLVAERRPVPVDRLADLLWPEIDPATGRERLNAAVYRLRRLLGLDADELVVRDHDGIALEPAAAWRIDSWEFRDRSLGSRDDRIDALMSYTGDFCSRQLAYDDAVIAERQALRARFVDIARALLDAGDVEPDAVVRCAQTLALDDPDLVDALAATLDAAGHGTEALMLRRHS